MTGSNGWTGRGGARSWDTSIKERDYDIETQETTVVAKMNLVRSSLLYFGIVFCAGFLLGPFRTLWVAPKVGERTAEVLEMPLMLAVSAAAARWIVRRFQVPIRDRLCLGFLALFFMLIAEFALLRRLRCLTIAEYVATRDPVSGAAYYCSLVLFALFPALLNRRHTTD